MIRPTIKSRRDQTIITATINTAAQRQWARRLISHWKSMRQDATVIRRGCTFVATIDNYGDRDEARFDAAYAAKIVAGKTKPTDDNPQVSRSDWKHIWAAL